jgi:photosystem II stability/assembly factor-like uncharacterized protein
MALGSYDKDCVGAILGRQQTDAIFDADAEITNEELESVNHCKLFVSTPKGGEAEPPRQDQDTFIRTDETLVGGQPQSGLPNQQRRANASGFSVKQGEEYYDASGYTYTCSGHDKDESGFPKGPQCNLIPPPLPAGVTRASLLSATRPDPQYQTPIGACQIFDGDKCTELKWEMVSDLQAGEITAIDISLTDPDVMYAGTDSNDMSMYRSLDGGSTWDLVHVAGHVGGVAISPTDPKNAIYTNLETANYQTLDRGKTWRRVVGNSPDEGQVAPFTAITFSKDQSQIAYTTALDPDTADGSRGGTWPPADTDVFRSQDEGRTWEKVGICKDCGSVQTLVVVEGDPDFVWAAADAGLFFSKDGGRSWSDTVIPRLQDRANEPENNKNGRVFPKVVGLALQPGNSNIMLAASSEFGMFKSTDGGSSWQESNEGLDPVRLHRVQFSNSNPRVAYVTTHDGVFKSENAGESWVERNHGLLDKYVNPIAVHPTNEDIVFVGTTNEMYTIHTEHQRRGMYEHGGIYKTVDGGANWARSDNGIVEAKVAQIGTHPLLPFNLWVGGESGRGNLFSPDGGHSWLFSGSMTAHYPMVYAFSNQIPTVIWATGWQVTGELVASTNGGANWYTRTHKLDEGLSAKTREFGLRLKGATDFHIHGVAVAPSDPNIIYVGSVHDAVYADLQFNLDGAHIFKSSDGGETFPEMSNGFPIETKTSINAIVVHPWNPDTAYVMTSLHETETAIGIYKTTDGARSWAAVNDGLDVFTNDLQIDPINPEVLYAATESGVFKTTSGAQSWKKTSSGIPKGPVIDLAIDPLNPLVVYAITAEDIYRTRDGAEHWYSINAGLPLLPNNTKALSAQDRLLAELRLDRTKTGHSMYGGTFAQDRTLEIDATGKLIVVAVKTNRSDGDKRNERLLYRAVITPLVSVAYTFEVNRTTIHVESQSNIYDMTFDENQRKIDFIAAGPPATASETSLAIPKTLLSGPYEVFIGGQKAPATPTNEGIAFSYVHDGRSNITIKGE